MRVIIKDAVAMADEYVYLSELLGVKVFDLKGRHIGILRDAALVPLIDPVRVDRYLVGAGPGWLSIRWDQIHSIVDGGIHLKDERLTPYHSDEYMLRMVRDLLDQQIIDAQGRKVVRVNDVTFARKTSTGHDVLQVLEVDIGLRSMLRRVLRGIVAPATIRALQSRIPPKSIPWEFCNILEADPQRRVRLNISNKLLEDMHPADLADIVENLSHEDRNALFNTMNSESAADLLSEVDHDMQTRIIENLNVDKAADILEEMEPSEAADLLNELEDDRSEEILEEMEPEEKEELEELLEFRENTAGGLMDTGYLSFPETSTVLDAMQELKKQEELLENLHNLFLVDEDDRLVASVPLARLLIAPGSTPLKDLASDLLLFVHSGEKQDRIAEMFDKYNLLTLPVVDDHQRLIGAITVDDIVALLRQG
jgi:magnesium transporter